MKTLIRPYGPLLAAILFACTAAHAAPPQTLNYQGNLTTAAGMAVPNGSQPMTFRLYSVASGGSPLYSETQTVAITNGLFNVQIGSVSPINLPFDVPYFLGVSVGADSEMTPRQPLASGAYAFRAASADAVAPAATVAGAQITGSITTATIPAANVVGGVGGAGTVTSVGTGPGLTGGPITGAGTIGLAATNLLPTTACVDGQVPKWSNGNWTCAADLSTPANNLPGQVLAHNGTSAQWTGSLTLEGSLNLAPSTAFAGNIFKDGFRFLHSYGPGNTFAGINAGSFTATGAYNIGMGFSALTSLTSGASNTAIGSNALPSNSSGYRNTAIGAAALLSNTSGDSNVAIGTDALKANIVGYGNSAIGNSALANTTGNRNIGIGDSAGGNLTTGNDNIAIGNSGVDGESRTIRIGFPFVQTRTFVAGIRDVTPAGGSVLPVVIDANGQLGTGGGAGGIGAVTNVATGPGLTGGPITATGTIGLAPTNLLPTTACADGQVPKWSNGMWTCAADGGVTSVATGPGLTGGPITATGTIGLAPTNLLPTTACADGQVPKWSNGIWTCGADLSTPANFVGGQVLTHNGSSASWTGSPLLAGTLNLANSTSLAGNIFKAGNRFLHDFGANNTFLGVLAGNFTMTGSGNTGMGRSALFGLTIGNSNTATGAFALSVNRSGDNNTATGYSALSANLVGSLNTANGWLALVNNTSGYDNTAIGASALEANQTGFRNTAVGKDSLWTNFSGARNIALGYQAGYNATGNDNIALGYQAGYNLTTGNDNIHIGHPGVAGESNTMRIGNIQQRTFIDGIYGRSPALSTARLVAIDANGQLGTSTIDVGLGIGAPQNRFHVADNKSDTGTPENHVMQIENFSTGTSPDVLALRVRTTGNIGGGVNFITFFSGDYVSNAGGTDQSLGAIQGNGSNSIVLVGAGNDFAEYVPKLDPTETMEPGEVVGVRGGKATRDLSNAEQIKVVSTGAIVAGNDPGEARRSQYALLAFIGQVDVKVVGPVNAGDYLVAQGNRAVAVAPAAMNASWIPLMVGRAWASSSEANEKPVRAAVGVERGEKQLVAALAEMREENRRSMQALREENQTLKSELALIKKALALR